MTKTYVVNEVFYSLQGEGRRAGTPNVFVRFAGCNLTCKLESHGFDCDTEFASGRKFTAEELAKAIEQEGGDCHSIILTGGEPLLQVDAELLKVLKTRMYHIAIETNGSFEVPDLIDWVTLSPKVAEHAIRAQRADELKYVRHHGQAIPKPKLDAPHRFISPAWGADGLDRRNLEWCIKLCKENPGWALSMQQHKLWGVR